jgi:hypothetical protein
VVTTSSGQKLTLRADTIVTALPLLSNDTLMGSLRGTIEEVYSVGDCKEPGMIVDAIDAGARISASI